MRLRRIAEALDLPPDHFFTDSAPQGSVADASECLRLWCRITTAEGRRRALDALRALADLDNT